jgi:aspartyl-tRNA(Asn)/glutamyl-tRNA(Gln) amidotransferase subunit C
MKKVSPTDVPIEHIAKLAHLNLTPEQLKTYKGHLGSILGHMQEITKLDLSTVPLTARVIEEENIWREDEVRPSFTQEEALQNAKNTHDGFVMVKAIFEDKGA